MLTHRSFDSRAAHSAATVSISASHARALFRAIVDQGHNLSEFVAAEGVSAQVVESSAQIPADVFGRLYQRAMVLLKDESLGMVSGGPVARGTFRMMCLCVIHRPNINAIVQRAGEFFDVCNAVAVKPQIVESNSDFCIGFSLVRDAQERSLDDILRKEGPLRIRTSLYMWHSLLSWFAGRSLPLVQVEFSFAPPTNGAQLSRLFRCPIVFNCEQSLIRFDPSASDMPNVQSEQSLSIFLKSAPYRLIVPSYHDQRLCDRVLAIFGHDFSQRLPSADQVSRQLAISVSTLRRQLKEEGTSFQCLKDECRRTAALQYLTSRELTFTDIAGLLGFDDVSAFYRAFKRWTNSTPSQYRDSLLSGS
jgi:AraC-like DNA-binding protein